jgi:hypothetical protein
MQKKLDEPDALKSTVTDVVAVGENVHVFVDTSTDDIQQATCTLPTGTIIKIYGHSCKADSGYPGIEKLWINFNIEDIPDSTGSVSNPCEMYSENNQLKSYWVPMFDLWECDTWSLVDLLEAYGDLGGYITSSGQESPESGISERISLEGEEGPNFVYSLVCKFAFREIGGTDDYGYFSSFGIADWECGSARGCKPAPWCGDGFFVCPINPIAAYIPEADDYGQDSMATLINACKSVNPHYVVMCGDARVSCTDDSDCNAVFEGNDNTCPGGYCDWQNADFFFLCSDIS